MKNKFVSRFLFGFFFVLCQSAKSELGEIKVKSDAPLVENLQISMVPDESDRFGHFVIGVLLQLKKTDDSKGETPTQISVDIRKGMELVASFAVSPARIESIPINLRTALAPDDRCFYFILNRAYSKDSRISFRYHDKFIQLDIGDWIGSGVVRGDYESQLKTGEDPPAKDWS